MTMPEEIEVEIRTAEGAFRVVVWPGKAPISAGNFLAYVDGGHLDGAVVYRIATLTNEPQKPHPIEVIQFGPPLSVVKAGPLLPPIAHEPTSLTGIRHLKGTLSTARFQVGTGGFGFFVTMRDDPELDEGGRRQPDGHGLAAFGRVVSGWDAVERIFARAEATDQLTSPIPIRMASRVIEIARS